MCGIAGVVELTPGRSPSREGLMRMARAMVHRGPDDEGILIRGRAGLAHRRLSIIDLESGQQPMETIDGRFSVVFNGEIYNFLEIRAELESQGHRFRTRSDTEVLLTLYSLEGVKGFRKLNGMYACAFWDRKREELVLLRDRLGKKPLFYYQDGKRFLFGSELKGLLAYCDLERAINLPALHEYLTYGNVVGENSILQKVRRLPPAHYLVFRDGQEDRQPYWELRFDPSPLPLDEREVEERLEQLLTEAVRRRMISDVPLGAFLSGGLDSSTVVALMARLANRRVRTFAIGFEEQDHTELEDARVVAQHLGTEHSEMIVKVSALDVLPDLVWHLDEPFADSSAVPTYYVCRAAREQVTVALSGDGGDEVFAGYRRYLELGRYVRMKAIPTEIRRWLVRPLVSLMPFTWRGYNYLHAASRAGDEKVFHTRGLYPHILDRLLTPDALAELRRTDPFERAGCLLTKVEHLDPVSCLQYLNTLQYLPHDILVKVDRMSMANSLEVRAPLLDYNLVEYAATLPVSLKLRNGVTKYILRKLCRKLLPHSVLGKRKQGFAIPKAKWFQGELKAEAREILLDRKTLQRGYFREKAVRTILDHHATGRRDYSVWIWTLMMLEMWQRVFLDAYHPTSRTAASTGIAVKS